MNTHGTPNRYCDPEDLRKLIKAVGLSRIEAGALLYSSPTTIDKWLQKAGTKGANPCPRWAVELLAYKTGQEVPSETGLTAVFKGRQNQVSLAA